jgi:tripartite-type tricarboxylate transporter receptor subunit TctC
MKTSLKHFAAGAALAAVALAGHTQGWPQKSITLVVPFAPGGGHDATARILAVRLGERLGQPVTVMNKPGANGMIGAQFVVRSAPDGYTLLMGSPAETVVAPFVYKDMAYAPRHDLAPVTLAATTPIVLVANPALGISSLSELIALAKRKPGTLSYGSPGEGSVHQLAVEMVKMIAGIDLLHVAYKGAGPATADVLGNQIPLASVGMAPVMPLIAAGKLRALNAFDDKPLSWDPSIHMANEVPGLQDVVAMQWMGVYAPAATPASVLDRLNGEIAAVVKDPATQGALHKIGVEAVGNSRKAFAEFLDREDKKYAALVKRIGLKVE